MEALSSINSKASKGGKILCCIITISIFIKKKLQNSMKNKLPIYK
jgi:hypothetical protein